jgi:hypothetical protein
MSPAKGVCHKKAQKAQMNRTGDLKGREENFCASLWPFMNRSLPREIILDFMLICGVNEQTL